MEIKDKNGNVLYNLEFAHYGEEFGVSDLARIKCTEKARWVNLPIVDLGKVKRRFDDISDVEQFKDDIIKSYERIKQYT